MGSAAARLALAAGFPAFFAGGALAQAPHVPMPSSVEVGHGLALANGCQDRDGYTLRSPSQPVGATFREVLCVEYGADAERRPIARCVYTGARIARRGRRGQLNYSDFGNGEGAIDLVRNGHLWLPVRDEE